VALCGLLIYGLLSGIAAPLHAQSIAPYQALLQNGQRVQGKALSDWHEPQRVPRLDGQALLEPGNPARWIRHRGLPLGELPAACVELHTGDCLPGNALLALTGAESPYDPRPAHLVVEPRIALEPTKERPVPRIRVDTSYVRRIVWQRRRKLDYQPGNLFFRDGRTLQFQAFRLEGSSVQILLDEGARRVSFAEISELHLPALSQPWRLHWEEMAILCTKPETRIWQLETTHGLIVTASPERFTPRFEGNGNDSIRWVHALQPAWSLDPLWIPVRDVAMWRFFAPHEIPLQRGLELHRGGKANPAAHWEANRNILGGPLRSMSTDFGAGIGLQAPSLLGLPLPPHVQALRGSVCLDRIAGRGGCARLRLKLQTGDQVATTVWESPLLQGSEVVAETGRLTVPAVREPESTALLIDVDQMHAGRPAGADPLDIRDHVNLADCWLELDAAAVQRELELRWPVRFAAWKDWQVSPLQSVNPDQRNIMVSQERRNLERSEEGFVPAIAMKEAPLCLSRQLTLQPDDRWLVLAASRVKNQGPPPKLEVRIAGQIAAEFEVPELRSNSDETQPLVVSLQPYHGLAQTNLPVEVRQLPGPGDASPVRWRGLTTTRHLPTVCQLYEDGASLTAESASPSQGATYDTVDRFSGRGSLKLTDNGWYRLGLQDSYQIRERPQWGEYRFVRFAVRRPQKQKQAKGRLALEFEAAAPGRRPYRLDTGRGKAAKEAAVRVWDGDLPEHWHVITRDLFADFGEFEIRDLLVSCFEGEGVAVDHIFLGRSPSDLDRLPPRPSSYEDGATTLKQWQEDIDKRMGPAIVGVEFADGRWTGGVVLKSEGEILVPGHALGAPNEDVTVHLHNGKTFPAKTKGICRDRDLGMVRSDKHEHLNAVPIWDQQEARLADDFVAMLLPQQLKGGFELKPLQYEVQQTARGQLWGAQQADDWQPGGVLFHRHGYLMALNIGRHPLGGLVFSRPIQGGLPDPIGRMRNGEVFGSWLTGSEPLLGLTVREELNRDEPSLVIDQVTLPHAAAAGFMPGDVVRQCEGKAVRTASELEAIVGQKNAGDELTFEILRGEAKQTCKLKLARRVP
jgi:S1-C subfamily serine protease